jgi:hypothetical protein
MPRTKPNPSVEYHTTSDLYVDPFVQRDPPTPFQITKLGKNWNRQQVGVLVGSLRDDGIIYLIDGQLRWLTAVDVDPDIQFLVEVHRGLTVQDEISLFLALNRDRRPVTRYDALIKSINRGEPPYDRLKEILDARGVHIRRASGPMRSKNVITAASIVDNIVRWPEGPDIFEYVMDVIIETWPNDEARFNGAIIMGVAKVVQLAQAQRYPLDRERLITSLQYNIPRAWEQKANALIQDRGSMTTRTNFGVVTNAVRILILDRYNKHLRTNRLELPERHPSRDSFGRYAEE